MSTKESLMASLTGEAPNPERSESPEQDLFGDIPLNDEEKPNALPPETAAANTDGGGQQIIPPGNVAAPAVSDPLMSAGTGVQANMQTPASNGFTPMSVPVMPTSQVPPPEKPRTSLLASSGLLGTASANGSSSGGGGGLFDDIDREQQEREREEAKRKALEAKQLEEARQKKLQEEQQRREQEAQRLQMQQQQQQQQQQQLLMQQQQQQQQMTQSQILPPMQTIPLGGSVMGQTATSALSPLQQTPLSQSMHLPSTAFQNQPPQSLATAPLAQSMHIPAQQGLVGAMQNVSINGAAPQQQQLSNQNMSFAERSKMMQQQAVVAHQLQQQQQQQQFQAQKQQLQQPNPFTPKPPAAAVAAAPGMKDAFSPTGFYREHPAPPAATAPTAARNLPPQRTPSNSRLSKPLAPGSTTAGMHNRMGQNAPKIPVTAPAKFEPIYGTVTVGEPLLVQPPSLFNVVPPHWTYQVTTQLKVAAPPHQNNNNNNAANNNNNGGCWMVRRRFRHVDALAGRLRQECPGAILPPKPDKHATRAIEEASALQTAEFAIQRAAEIQVYLNALVRHPYAGQSTSLKLFLALQDDIGTAWAEVSPNALTRLSAVGAGAASKVAGQSNFWEDNTYEDDAQLLALASSEGLRMGAVTQAVPKLEGAVTLMREHGECGGAVGMELSKLSKEVEASDHDLGVPIEILSQGLLKSGRRQKRLALELSAAMNPFVSQYKLCKNEKAAFEDRKHALQKRVKERGRADLQAQRLMMNHRTMQVQGRYDDLSYMERDASRTDQAAVGAVHHCDFIGNTLKSEVNRIAFQRRNEWNKSMKVVCSSMKEATSEHRAIWESTKDLFQQAFPEYNS